MTNCIMRDTYGDRRFKNSGARLLENGILYEDIGVAPA